MSAKRSKRRPPVKQAKADAARSRAKAASILSQPLPALEDRIDKLRTQCNRAGIGFTLVLAHPNGGIGMVGNLKRSGQIFLLNRAAEIVAKARLEKGESSDSTNDGK
jgi:hypothetical protein